MSTKKEPYVLPLRKVQQIAHDTALRHGLTPPRRDRIDMMYQLGPKNSLPVIQRCERGMLWVDRTYVAYQIGTGEIHFTYITRSHIREEISSYREASRERHTLIPFPADLLATYRRMNEKMRKAGLPFWVEKPWERYMQDYIENQSAAG